jgi:hypothetical protein
MVVVGETLLATAQPCGRAMSGSREFNSITSNSHFGDNLSSFWKEQLLVFCHI